MRIFKTYFISGVPFVSGLLSIEVVTRATLLLGSKEFWGKCPNASLMGHMYISLRDVLLLLVPFSALFFYLREINVMYLKKVLYLGANEQ